MFWTTFCLRKPHLEQTENHSYVPHMVEIMSFPFVSPKTCACIAHSSAHIRVLLQGVSVRILIGIYSQYVLFSAQVLRTISVDHYLLQETTLRTYMYSYFTFGYTCAENFSGIACENIDRYLLFACYGW